MMRQIKKVRGYQTMWVVIIGIMIIGLLIAAKYDLFINQTVYSPESKFAPYMEIFGWIPAFLPSILLFLLLGSKPETDGLKQLILGILAVIGATILAFVSENYMENYFESKRSVIRLWHIFAAVTIGVYLFMIYFLSLTTEFRQKMIWYTVTASVFIVAIVIVTNLVKIIWMRTRFDEMISRNNFSAFTPWYLPFGNGGRSFPSGHTAQAAGILSLLFLCDVFLVWNQYKVFICVLCWLYIGAMAASRIILGRHFLSDTIASSAIVSIIFFILINSQFYQDLIYRLCILENGS